MIPRVPRVFFYSTPVDFSPQWKKSRGSRGESTVPAPREHYLFRPCPRRLAVARLGERRCATLMVSELEPVARIEDPSVAAEVLRYKRAFNGVLRPDPGTRRRNE